MFAPPFPPDRTPPHHVQCDVAVLGAGFGGSLTACCLRAGGLSVALIDSGRLPRFALGETLTPPAAALLQTLAERFRLAWLPPLLDPVEHERAGPGVRSGRSRGTAWVPVSATGEAAEPLMVEFAGPLGAHWHRGDLDAFTAARAVAADAVFFDRTVLRSAERNAGGGYVLTGARDERTVPGDTEANPAAPVRIEARFLIDAGPPLGTSRSADDPGLAALLGLPDETASLATRTQLTYAHASGLEPLEYPIVEDGADGAADGATVHHVFTDGWYRELRFADGTASVARSAPVQDGQGDDDRRDGDPFRLSGRGGGVAERHGRSTHAAPGSAPVSLGPFQRRSGRVAGSDYALLPAAAAAIDPLHDPDLAHTAAAVLRLCTLLSEEWTRPTLATAVARYGAALDRELNRIDGLTAPAYAALGDWDTFQLAVRLFEAASAGAENLAGEDGGDFLLAGDADFSAAALAFSEGVGRLGANELADALRLSVPHDGGRFFPID
ncbi:NAD(P)/FAD-dependent oxidoreductase [Alienimonas chondri]|uniref:Uncharacterized protein n=1 Tax=Alienimonas chondri TaxID=2681879 RepID=A0ABX1VEF0_9PLAN|nr:hypothetical protein [Alienimonas chondri]NNJ26488.1 hypothetical protein [Alienimonas chondri]